MPIFQINSKHVFACAPPDLWDVISQPKTWVNLFPESMKFSYVGNNSGEERLYPGMIHRYKVRNLLGFEIDWEAEIVHVKPYKYFTDEMRKGPFRVFNHEFMIEETEHGVAVYDVFTYGLKYRFAANLLNSLFFKKNLKHILAYRNEQLAELCVKKMNGNLKVIKAG